MRKLFQSIRRAVRRKKFKRPRPLQPTSARGDERREQRADFRARVSEDPMHKTTRNERKAWNRAGRPKNVKKFLKELRA